MIRCTISVFMLATLLATASSALSEVIVRDDFNAAWNGHAPATTNLPGGTWTADASWGVDDQTTYLGDTVGRIAVDEEAKVSLASSGSYTEPTALELTARLAVNEPGTDSPFRGGFVGYSSVATAGNVRGNLYGIVLRGDDGQIGLVDNNALVQTFAYQGTWDNSAFHTVDYDVDTTTGSISKVTVDGVTYNFSPVSFFTPSVTSNLAWYASSQVGGPYYTQMDYIQVASVPEPATAGLLGLGVIGLLNKRRK